MKILCCGKTPSIENLKLLLVDSGNNIVHEIEKIDIESPYEVYEPMSELEKFNKIKQQREFRKLCKKGKFK